MTSTTQLEVITDGLSGEIQELERLYDRLPEVIAKKRAQLAKLQEVAKIMTDESAEDDGILRSLIGLSGTPRVARGRKQRGMNLPTRVMTLLNAAGPRGLEFKGILGNLEESGGAVNRSHLLTTLKRLVDRGKLENINGRYHAV
jgi:hypothetical protein